MVKHARIWLAVAVLSTGAWGAATPLPADEAEVAPRSSPLFRLMSAQKHQQYRAMLPKVDDPQTQALLDDPRLILYTEAEMPRAYQFWGNQLQGIHSAYYNISANGREPFGNGNREFPWGTPAGTHRSTSVRSFRLLWLPHDARGEFHPIVWYRRRSSDGSMGYAWTFPVGAILGEVLQQRGPDGRYYTFELRLRNREENDWGVDVFRPFPTAEDLARRIRELRPQPDGQAALISLISHLEEPKKLPNQTLADRHPRRTFDQRMGVDVLPPLDDALAIELLTTTTFRSALGETWRHGVDGNYTFAPTTSDRFHVVPQNYDAGFISVDRFSCIRCHETVNQNVNRFQAGRDWYGRIRGSDGIFSFHPFALSTVSSSGFGHGVAMRRELIDAGVIAAYQQTAHSKNVYRQISHIKE